MSVLEAGEFAQLVGLLQCASGWGDPQPLFLSVALSRSIWEVDDANQMCLLLVASMRKGADMVYSWASPSFET